MDEYEAASDNLNYACSIVRTHEKALSHLTLPEAKFKNAPLSIFSGLVAFARLADARLEALAKIKKHKKVDSKGFGKRITSMEAYDSTIRNELRETTGGILKTILEAELASATSMWHDLYKLVSGGYAAAVESTHAIAADTTLNCAAMYKSSDAIDCAKLLIVSNSSKAKEFMQQWQAGASEHVSSQQSETLATLLR